MVQLRVPEGKVHPPNILAGRVTRVDAETGLLDVTVTSPFQRILRNCEVATMFRAQGMGGFDFKATLNAECILIESLSTSPTGTAAAPVIIGFRNLGPAAAASRAELTPGDVRVQGANGSDLLLRNNGDVYLLSDQQCLLALLGTEELVRLNAPSFEQYTGGGSLRWVVSADNTGGPVAYLLGIKEFESDAKPYLTVSAGAAMGGGLNVTLLRPGAAGGSDNDMFTNLVDSAAGFHFQVESTGDVGLSATGTWIQESLGPMLFSSNSALGLSAPALSLGTGAATAELKNDGTVTVVSPGGAGLEAPSLRLAVGGVPLLTSDDTEESKRVVNIELLSWLFNHTHATPAGITLPPLGSPDDGGGPTQAELATQLAAMTRTFLALNALLTALNVAVGGAVAQQLAEYTEAIAPFVLPNAPLQVLLSRDEVLTSDTKVR